SSRRSRLCSQPFPTASPDHIPDHVPDQFPDYVPNRFPDDVPDLFPIRSTIPSRQESVYPHPVPSTKWLPTFHSRPAVNKREPFPIPSLGITQTFPANRSRPVSAPR
ncbi:unnamed protein product, partial [Laminaria digitata]